MGEESPKGVFYLHSRHTHVKLNFVLPNRATEEQGVAPRGSCLTAGESARVTRVMMTLARHAARGPTP